MEGNHGGRPSHPPNNESPGMQKRGREAPPPSRARQPRNANQQEGNGQQPSK